MPGHDAELDQFRQGVSCAVLLEQATPPWRLDRKGSTRRALKYRRHEGEVVIVNHDGRGWWDPQSSAKGDVFDLVQFLDPGLNFGQVRRTLRPFVGLSPTFLEALPKRRTPETERPLPERWATRPRLRPGSRAWDYLSGTRALPRAVLMAVSEADAARDGAYGSAWFAHRDGAGQVCHIEVRGPDFKGSLHGGTKTLFRLAGGSSPTRLAILEAPIDALSLAAIENIRHDTLYVATGGGIGAGTIDALQGVLSGLQAAGNVVVSAADANSAGDRFASQHQAMAVQAGIPFERLRPSIGTDWNDVLRQGRGV
jgi:hypothetical protein